MAYLAVTTKRLRMNNFSATKYASFFKGITTRQPGLGQMLLLATIIHLLLLFSFDISLNPLPVAQKMVTSVLDVTLNASAQQETTTSSSIAPQNRQSSESTDVIFSSQKLSSPKEMASSVDDKLLEQPPLITETFAPSPNAQSSKFVRKRTISAASHETKDAAYLARWQSYVEEFGNHHYPKIALKNNLRGELRLLVAIKKDGTVHEVSVRQSSGSAALDQAAIEIVYHAAPFEPLPNELAGDIEVLEIIRTWQFRGKLSTSV